MRRRDVGYVFQRLNLVAGLTAIENVMLPLELDGVGRREARSQAIDALHAVALEQSLDRYPDDFSGGQQQRIAIARAIVGTRSLLLADEPTGSLDTTTGDAVIELLATLPVERNTAVVLVTHEPRYAAWADRVISIRDGRIVDVAMAPAARRQRHPGRRPMTTSRRTTRGGLVGFRLALRLARREILRRPGRTLLVALLVALPVASMTVAVVMVRTQHETPVQLWQQQNGNADAAVYTNAVGQITANLANAAPEQDRERAHRGRGAAAAHGRLAPEHGGDLDLRHDRPDHTRDRPGLVGARADESQRGVPDARRGARSCE